MNKQTIGSAKAVVAVAAAAWTPDEGRMTEAQYTALRGCRCPSCGSSDVEGGFVNIDGGTASQAVCCGECGAGWSDTYTLMGYADLDGGLDHDAVNSVVEDVELRSKKYEFSIDSEEQAHELVSESCGALDIVLGKAETDLAVSKLRR